MGDMKEAGMAGGY